MAKRDQNSKILDNSIASVTGLPCNVDVERFVLGSIFRSRDALTSAIGKLTADDFSLEVNRRIFHHILGVHSQGMPVDRVTVANELMRAKELTNIGGLSYLTSLDDQMPEVKSIDGWVAILREKAGLRRLIFRSQHEMNQALSGEPLRDILESSVAARLDLMPEDPDTRSLLPGEIVDQFEGGINSFLQPHLRSSGILTGFTKFDDMTGGLQRGDLIVLSGRPGHGKSAFALNICDFVALKSTEGRALVFSLEMSREQLLQRMICSLARVDSQRFRRGYVNAGEREKITKAEYALHSSNRIIIDDAGSTNPLDVQIKIRKLSRKHGPISLVVIDYLQMMAAKDRSDNRSREIGMMTRSLKLTAKEEGVAMLVISSINRKPDERKGNFRPMLSDMRESGAIESDADIVAAMFREELYNATEDNRGEAELILLKNRNGPSGTVKLVFLGHLTKFESRAEDIPDDQPPLHDDWKERQSGGKHK